MPAIAKSRSSKHAQTPYTRKKKKSSRQSDDAVTIQEAKATGILEHATKGLYRLVSWVFSHSEDLSKNVGASASKVVHREPPKRSLTSQLEDGTLNNETGASQSIFAPELVPHYLGKTPKAVRAGRENKAKDSNGAQTFQLPTFNSSLFKIPALPSPESTKSRDIAHDQQSRHVDHSSSRTQGVKSLEISEHTQSRHDEETLAWLASQNLTPEELTSRLDVHEIKVDDYDKLSKILGDTGFFRRRGLFPPVCVSTRSTRRSSQECDSGNPSRSRPDHKDHHNKVRSANVPRDRHIDPHNWHTSSSTGILAAWREICQLNESSQQNQSMKHDTNLQSSQSTTRVPQKNESMLWHEDVSFSQKTEPDLLDPVPELDVNVVEAGEKYWAPIRSFPMPVHPDDKDSEMRSIVNTFRTASQRQRRHSRQPSIARRPQKTNNTRASAQSPRTSRPHTPASAASSRPSTARRPVNANRGGSRSRQVSPAAENHTVQMVDSQVQTTDELMNFLAESESEDYPAPIISKERRKRPGCFSALDEDMEEIFGPYSDIPLKRIKMDLEDEAISPRIPVLRDSEDVKKLRARQEAAQASSTLPDVAPTVERFESAPTRDSVRQGDARVIETAKENPTSQAFPATSDKEDNAKGNATASKLSSEGSESQTLEKPAAMAPATSFKFGDNPVKESDSLPASGAAKFAPTFDFGHTDANDKQPVTNNSSLPSDTSTPKFSFASTTKSQPAAGDLDSFSSANTQGIPSTTSIPKFSFGNNTGLKEATSFEFGQAASNAAPTTGSSGAEKEPLGVTGNDKPISVVKDSSGKSPQDIQGPDRIAEPEPPKFPAGSSKTAETQPKFSFDLVKQPPLATATPSETNFSFAPTMNSKPTINQAVGIAKEQPKFFFGNPKSVESGSTPAEGSQPVFSFGSSKEKSTSESTTTATTTTPQAVPVFSFGKGSVQPSANKLPFGNQAENSESLATSAKAQQQSEVMPQSKTESTTTPTFSFGISSNAGTTPPFGAAQATNTKGDNSKSMFGANNQFATSAPAFGSAITPNSSEKPIFGSAAPQTEKPIAAFGTNQNTPSFGGPSTNGFGFGSAQGSNAFANVASAAPTNVFGIQKPAETTTPAFGALNAGTPAPGVFGATSNSTAPIPAFGAPTTGTPALGAFGARTNSTAPTPTFGFGSSSSITPTAPVPGPSGFTFGQNSAAAPAAGSFQFGSGQTSAQPQQFAFGQPQAAPGSGFASPAAQSPSLQSATAPGSPNPFTFNAAPSASGAGAASSGTRKIAQPRSRRPRAGR